MKLHISTGTLDLDRSRFEPDDGTTVSLTSREVAMLRYLAEHAGEDVSRDDLRCEVWGQHALSMSRAVDTTVRRLRRKIESDPKTPESLCTVHGEGYRLVLASTERARPTPVLRRAARVLPLGDRSVDLGSGLVRGEGPTQQLTAQECRLLTALADRPGVVVDPERLARLADVTGGRPALANAVYRLRAKVEADPTEPRWVVGVRNRGYRLDAEPQRPGFRALRETLWSVADHAGQILGLEDCVVYTRDGNHLVQAAAFGSKAPSFGDIESPITLHIGEGIVGAAARTGRPQCVQDVRVDPRYVSDLFPARSELAVPILKDDEVVGVLDSESSHPSAYGTQHQVAFASLARIAAAAARDLGMALAC